MNSLATKLSVAFILVVVLGVASVSILVRIETARDFESYLEARGGTYLARAADSLAQLYQQNGDWKNAQPMLSDLLRGPTDRLVLSDASGRIVADTDGELVGRSAEGLNAVNQAPITVGSTRVGTIYLLSFTPGPSASAGRGQGAGPPPGRGPGAVTGAATPQMPSVSLESSYLASVDRAILTTAVISAIIAIAAGLFVSRKITRPLSRLAAASQEVASGRLDRRLEVTSDDELGRVSSTFNAMAESLQRNEEARRHMVADIAHDLRTPLAVIQGTVDGMLDGVIAPDRDNMESIKEEVALLTKLVADLRTLSLAEAGQLKLDRSKVDLLAFAQRAVLKVEPMARGRGISCRVEGQTPAPVVEIDSDRMGQVLGNLLDNALRYTPEGGTITVSVDRNAAGRAVLSVADTGIGISSADLAHIFDRFYRADRSRTRKSGGSGLGLAIVKQLVLAHDGRVWAESRPDAGSRFSIELPTVNP
ncbi:MAG: ATP-binding protein [Actinobacteria bacterium]|nr:ATP-binding protein [Actinomycetota bacterium]